MCHGALRLLFSNLASNSSGSLEKSVNFQNPQTLAAARTAGCCEKALARKAPMPFSCFLFRPRKSREKRRKRSHTNVSNASVTRTSTPPAQTAHIRFHERKWVHTRLSEKDRTQRLTRRNRGRFGWGGITTLGAFRTFANIPGPGIRTANFAALGTWSRVLSKNAESLRDSDALMRVAVPKASRPRWAA